MCNTEHQLTAGDVVSVSVVRALSGSEERVNIEIGAQHAWVSLSDIREWRRVAALHVYQRPLIERANALATLRVMPPRLGAKIADGTCMSLTSLHAPTWSHYSLTA
jgi:hypothetical protein